MVAFLHHLFRGSDNFTISGAVSSIWGDYQSVPAGGTITLGDDILRVFSSLTSPAGSASTVIFGDAQTAGTGSSAIAGDDIIDAGIGRRGANLYGDFQSVSGTVAYGNDALYGCSQADTIYGDSSTSSAQGGKDYVDGGSGNDYLFGGGGADILRGGYGADSLDGALASMWLPTGAPSAWRLIYDSNGSVAGGAVQVAKIGAGLAITNADFFVV